MFRRKPYSCPSCGLLKWTKQLWGEKLQNFRHVPPDSGSFLLFLNQTVQVEQLIFLLLYICCFSVTKDYLPWDLKAAGMSCWAFRGACDLLMHLTGSQTTFSCMKNCLLLSRFFIHIFRGSSQWTVLVFKVSLISLIGKDDVTALYNIKHWPNMRYKSVSHLWPWWQSSAP